MQNEDTYLLCIRKGESPVVPGTICTNCSKCKVETMTAPSGVEALEKGAKIICMDCFRDLDDDLNFGSPAPGAISELKKFLAENN